MTVRRNLADSPDIIDRLRDIQKQENREVEASRYLIEAIPFVEAPTGIKGLMRFCEPDGRSTLRIGLRCEKCPVPLNACGCHTRIGTGKTAHWMKFPAGWIE